MALPTRGPPFSHADSVLSPRRPPLANVVALPYPRTFNCHPMLTPHYRHSSYESTSWWSSEAVVSVNPA